MYTRAVSLCVLTISTGQRYSSAREVGEYFPFCPVPPPSRPRFSRPLCRIATFTQSLRPELTSSRSIGIPRREKPLRFLGSVALLPLSTPVTSTSQGMGKRPMVRHWFPMNHAERSTPMMKFILTFRTRGLWTTTRTSEKRRTPQR